MYNTLYTFAERGPGGLGCFLVPSLGVGKLRWYDAITVRLAVRVAGRSGFVLTRSQFLMRWLLDRPLMNKSGSILGLGKGLVVVVVGGGCGWWWW